MWGCFGGGEKWTRWGLSGRGCDFFLARWMAHGALAVMQHNAAVSQPPLVLAGGVGTAARRLRPQPGPTQARAALGRDPELLLPCHVASAGCGVRRTRSPSCEGGVFSLGAPLRPACWAVLG